MQHRGNVLMGLRTDVDASSDSDNFFSSDDNDGILQIQKLTPPPIQIESTPGIIKSFDDMSPHLSSIFANLENYIIPKVCQTDVYFIPENIVPDELSRAIADFGKDPSNVDNIKFILNFESDNFPDAILAQIELINFYHTKNNEKLTQFLDKKINSRVLSLIHFALIENKSRQVSLYHEAISLEEYIKFPTPAPLGAIFPDFTVEKLIKRLCADLASEFPHHPLLESALSNFMDFCKDDSYIKYINNLITQLNEFENETDDSSEDSFFLRLKEKQKSELNTQPIIILPQCETNFNPLDPQYRIPANRYEPVMLREPPQMVTFLLSDDTDQMSPSSFENWIFSIRVDRPETIKNANHYASVNKSHGSMNHSYKSNPINSPNLGQSDEGSTFDESVDFFFNLLHHVDDQPIIKQQLPTTITPGFYSIYLPVLHTLNIANETVEMRGAIYTKLLAKEKDAHFGLKLDDPARAERTLTYLKTIVPQNYQFEQKQPHKLDTKRQQPPLTPENPETFVALMAVVDYELIIHSRSPLSLQYYTVSVEDRQNDHLLCDPKWRASFLFWQYTVNTLSPYMCFRVAFALAVNLAERNRDLACSFVFEGLYTLLYNIPFVRKLPCIRSALLFFGELLERLNRYYYAAHVLDNFFLTDIRNASYSSKIAQIAQKNNDSVRSLFHYIQTLKNFVAHGSVDEALYVGQVISSIYIENGLYSLAMALLTYLLHLSYGITVGKKREKMDVVALGSLRIPRSRTTKLATFSEFKPDVTNTSTIISATTLAILFSKMGHFNHAKKLLETAMNNANSSIKKLIMYAQALISLKENDIETMLKVAPKIEINKASQRPSLSSHFNLMSASNFDPNSATLRLFTRAYLDRNQFREAFLYSELFIHSISWSNMKELGCGLFLRGLALIQAYYYCQDTIMLFDPNIKSPIQTKYRYKNIEYNKEQIARMAFNSISASRVCFSRVSATNKSILASLIVLDMLFSIPSLKSDNILNTLENLSNLENANSENNNDKKDKSENKQDTKPQHKREDKKLKLLITFPGNHAELPQLIDNSTADEILISLDHSTAKILDPFYLIHYELLTSQHNIKKGKLNLAQTQFDFAFNNFQRLFTCGYRLIPVDLRIRKLRYVTGLLEKMCSLLINFDTDFINDRLLTFDIYNDACCILKNRLRNIEMSSTNSIDPQVDISPYVLDLENPKFPSFASILKSNGFITENHQTFTELAKITECLDYITSNVNLFNKEKLTTEDLQNRNRKLCDLIESIAETNRRQNTSQLPPETSFSFLQRSKPYVSGAVFIQKIFREIVIYVPSTGFMRKVEYTSADGHLAISDGKTEFDFKLRSNLFEPKFIEFCASLVLSDKKAKKPNINNKSLKQVAKTIFSSHLARNLAKNKMKIVDDSSSFGSTNFFAKNSAKKGTLFTLDPGDSPLIFIVSHDLQFIPFELIFQNSMLIRCPFFMQLMLRNLNNARLSIPRPIVCRYRSDGHLIQRTKDLLGELFSSLCITEPNLYFVDGVERSTSFPTPLFSSTKELDPKKYAFCDFVDVEPTEFPKTQNASSSLFVFSFSDLCEMPTLVRRVMSEYPFSFFMFIPVTVMKEAFREMRHIFERQNKRVSYLNNDGNKESNDEPNRVVCDNPMIFVLDLQITLQKTLKVPIPLITYLH
ncbi:hypothetical protein TRFO_24566 [Tritrichomonas foetus]|uniref:Uncharacterized protein n=1 Tax=Tritrichomonas foetus TaxID=1144522 RepID=A0A1J4K7X8_9EUKA|nr:hypothetical protein TRFO_24566 [Tritrichomonas foetus]|eukprot:OHT07307.1 hypothetical protein TRFO_24566 [Tritrichomonas foetus]